MKQMKLTCMALAVLMIGSVLSGKLFAQTGEFRLQNFATDTGNGNFVYRGYVFSPQRDVVVNGMWGGFGSNCTQFGGAIYDATLLAGGTDDVPHWTIGNIVAEVVFDGLGPGEPGIDDTPEYQAFAAPVTLVAANYYIIAQGRIDGGSGCHFNADALDFNFIVPGSPILSHWYPNANSQYMVGNTGTPSDQTPSSLTTTDGVRVLLGFNYDTDVNFATFPDPLVNTKAYEVTGTNDIYLTGLLGNSGVPTTGVGAGTETALFFEISPPNDNSWSGGSTLFAADPAAVTGPVANLDFSLTIEDWLDDKNPGDTYYVRAVAINEAGRVEGETVEFTIGQMNQWPEIPLAWWSIGILFAGIVGFMGYRQRKRFA